MKTRLLTKQYGLPYPILVLVSPPTKLRFNKLVRNKVLEYWHSKLLNDMETKSSLKFLKASFLPLGVGPHPLWLSCEGSQTAIAAAVIQATIITGRYRDDYLVSKWNPQYTGNCSNCNFFPGDVTHYLSGNCPSLSSQLQITLDR